MNISDGLESPEVQDQAVLELQARGDVPVQQTSSVATGTTIPVTSGGTGATTATGARASLGAAPNDAVYIVQAANGELTAELVLGGTANQITVTAGAGTMTISIPATLSITTAYQVGGTQVMNARKTGWGVASGTLSRAAYASYAGQTVSAGYVQAEAQATDDALKALAQRVAALITDLTSHGLIGA